MQQLTNEEIARVYGMYVPCTLNYHDNPSLTYYGIEGVVANGIQLLLTPLSKISDEDAIEVAKLDNFPTKKETPDPISIEKTKHGFIAKSSLYEQEYKQHGLMNYRQHQYLISKGYAVPIYFSPNHPLNGKNPIELGIAIDKTTLN
jgi:hypothetical protein